MKSVRWVGRIVLIFGLIATPYAAIQSETVSAQRAINKGYFTGKDLTEERFNVIDNGIPGTLASKDEFVRFIENLYRTSLLRNTVQRDRDFVGASYVIQTMRGGTDTEFPTESDIQDWKARLSNPAITARWGNFSAAINSGRLNFSQPSRDAARYYGDGVNYRSFLFYNNGTLVYAVKQICANPLGNLPGIPQLPPPATFNLTPTVTGSPSVSEAQSTVNVAPTVTNSPANATSASAAWRLVQFTVPAGQAVPGASTNGTNPNTYYGYGASTVTEGSRTFPRGATSVGAGNRTLPDAEVNSRVCFALSVRPVTQASGNWRHSTPFCITIAKKPKLQVIGGDTLVGRGSISPSTIVTSTSQKVISGVPETFGSWGEYAVSATGVITGMASGAGYSGGAPGVNFCTVSYLTFGNAGTSTCQQNTPKGTFNAGTAMPNFSAWFGNGQPLGNVANVDVASGARPSGVYSTNRSISVNASSAVSNRWIVINAPGQTVTITGDITYASGAITSVSQIPQVVIIANRINISESVNRVDAWLVATGVNGTLNTCSQITNPATQLFSNRCSNQLTVNGPVSARQLLLYRTAGAGTGANAGDPAEVFNLRPDAYMWAMNYQADSARVQTVYTQELPPRF